AIGRGDGPNRVRRRFRRDHSYTGLPKHRDLPHRSMGKPPYEAGHTQRPGLYVSGKRWPYDTILRRIEMRMARFHCARCLSRYDGDSLRQTGKPPGRRTWWSIRNPTDPGKNPAHAPGWL